MGVQGDGQDDEKSRQDSSDGLHTGDVVLLRCLLTSSVGTNHASHVVNGYIRANGHGSSLSVDPGDRASGATVREFLFFVTESQSYIAQKDLRRHRKDVAAAAALEAAQSLDGEVYVSPEQELRARAQLQFFEQRAKAEAEVNFQCTQATPKALHYGDVVQLQSLSTGRYITIRSKSTFVGLPPGRRIGLEEGSAKSRFCLAAFFKHRTQGDPIDIGEQVLLESDKLGSPWRINFSENLDPDTGKRISWEVTCESREQGICLDLYSRARTTIPPSPQHPSLGFGSAVRFYHAHREGFLSASCRVSKDQPYLRHMPNLDLAAFAGAAQCAKDVWVLESGVGNLQPIGIQWHSPRYPVYVRHLGSGRYLAVNINHAVFLPQKPSTLVRNNVEQSYQDYATEHVDDDVAIAEKHLYAATLEVLPTESCAFSLEPLNALIRAECKNRNSSHKPIVRRHSDHSCLLLRWKSLLKAHEHIPPLFLSSFGEQKGQRQSLKLCWSSVMRTLDAFRLDMDLSSDPWLADVEVVVSHTAFTKMDLLPRCRNWTTVSETIKVCAEIDHALQDMIYFLSQSPKWRTKASVTAGADAMTEPWIVVAGRQRLVRELTYIDAVFDLFTILVAQTPQLTDDSAIASYRRGQEVQDVNTMITASELLEGTDLATLKQQRFESIVAPMKTRCLKLLVRVWLYCFLGSEQNVAYLRKHEWVDIINSLNGHGLGSSEVFVALISNNPDLARDVDKWTLLRFYEFIRKLGPSDTWLSFLGSVCAPQGHSIGVKQQEVLCGLVMRGYRASEADRAKTRRNKGELLVEFRMGPSLRIPLARHLETGTPQRLECIGADLIVDGIADVAVAWAHPEGDWVVGETVLYHSPEALEVPLLSGMPVLDAQGRPNRKWVSLSQVVWVLEPEKFCEVATGISWDHMRDQGSTPGQGRQKSHLAGSRTRMAFDSVHYTKQDQLSRVAKLRHLASYILAQLHLMALLAKDRQMNSTMALQDEYSFRLCVCGVSDQRLPTSVRAAFFDLLTHLWLDRQPHAQVVVPSVLRTLPKKAALQSQLEELPGFELAGPDDPDSWSPEHLEALPVEVLDFYKFTHAHKMEAAVSAVQQHICAGPSSEQQVHSDTSDSKCMLSVLKNLELLLRFGFVNSVHRLKEILGCILRCLDGRTDYIKAPQSQMQPHYVRRSIIVQDAFIKVHNADGQTEGLRAQDDYAVLSSPNGSSALPRSRFPLPEDGHFRYVATEDSKIISACKTEMLRVLNHIMQASTHVKITKFLHQFAWQMDDEYEPEEDWHVQALFRVLEDPTLSLSQRGTRAPIVMFIDLMMYEDPKLCALALEAVFRFACPAEDLWDSLRKVELLDAKQQELYKSVKYDVQVLGRIIHCFENWGVDDEFSEMDMSKLFVLQQVCDKLRRYSTQGVSSFNTSQKELQNMLRETEFFPNALFMLKVGTEDTDEQSRALLCKVQAALCGPLAGFLDGYEKNQELMFPVIPSIVELLDGLPESVQVMTATFRGNFDHCSQVNSAWVRKVCNLLARDRKQGKFSPWYLEFLATIVAVGRMSVSSCQIMVLEELQRLSVEDVLHLLQGESSTDGWRRVLLLADKFKSVEQFPWIEISTWDRVPADDRELIYYVRSLELLVGLCLGGHETSIMQRAYVEQLLPVRTAVLLLLRLDHQFRSEAESPEAMMEKLAWTYKSAADSDQMLQTLGSEAEKQASEESFNVIRHLKTLYLGLICLLIYDIDASGCVDLDLLNMPQHVELLAKIHQWLTESLRPPRLVHTAASESPFIPADEENLLNALLRCIDCFFHGPYQQVLKRGISTPGLAEVVEDIKRFFVDLAAEPKLWIIGRLRQPDALQSATHRVVLATQALRKDVRAQEGVPWRIMVADETSLHSFLDDIRTRPEFQARVQADEARLGSVLAHISHLTDPLDADYCAQMPESPDDALPDGVDFRRNVIAVDGLVRRLVVHCQDNIHTDLQSVRLVQRALLAMLAATRAEKDPSQLEMCQSSLVKSGVIRLIILMLHEQVASDITVTAWMMMGEMLSDHDFKVNKDVQEHLYQEVSKPNDDHGMWFSYSHMVSAAGSKVKSIRKLQVLSSLNLYEQRSIDEFEASLDKCCLSMRALRLMVEGHHFQMQQILFLQVGNKRSANVAAYTAQLFQQLCRDPAAGDLMSSKELECVTQILLLLTECMQGPNLRTQGYLSSLALIESTFLLLHSSFERFVNEEGDVYPSSLRKLKASLVQLLLALLEGRMDSAIHKMVAMRCEVEVLRERITFVHLYFVFGSHLAEHDLSQASAAVVPADSVASALLAHSADPTKVFERLIAESAHADEILMNIDDDELHELFTEGISIIELIYSVTPHSERLKKEVWPIPHEEDGFVDDVRLHPTRKQYYEELSAFHRREIYRQAFNYLSRFVRTVEVLVSGQLQGLHFPQPATFLYVTSATRAMILDTVPFSSADVKAKAFVSMCLEAHREAKLIRALSKYSLVPSRFTKLAQRHLPDAAHRPFQIFLKDDALKMGLLLRSSLFISILLAAHIGYFLERPGKSPWDRFPSQIHSQIVFALGSAHLICTLLWLSVMFSIQVPLKLELAESGNDVVEESGRWRFGVVIVTILQVLAIPKFFWRFTLFCFCAVALVSEHIWLFNFLLLDCFAQSSILAAIMYSVSIPIVAVLMTFLGAEIVTWLYATIGFHNFGDEFGDYCNTTIETCAQNIMYQGTRAGIVGLSGMMTLTAPHHSDFFARMAFDVSYFIVFGIFLLNTIVALIVDSFILSRQDAQEREAFFKTQTFISGIDRTRVEAISNELGIRDGFEHHEASRQPKWEYMGLIFYLMEKDEQNCTGPQRKIKRMIETSNPAWLPMGRSLMLEGKKDSEGLDHLQRIERHANEFLKRLQIVEAHSVLFSNKVAVLDGLSEERLNNLIGRVESVCQNPAVRMMANRRSEPSRSIVMDTGMAIRGDRSKISDMLRRSAEVLGNAFK